MFYDKYCDNNFEIMKKCENEVVASNKNQLNMD